MGSRWVLPSTILENLLDAGLIEVTKTKYSVKGREVKVYGLKDQLLIVTPRVTNVRALLLKYASLFGVVAVATVVIGAVLQLLAPGREHGVVLWRIGKVKG